MWPWEHVVIGYLAYSLCCRAYYGRPPRGGEAFAAVFGSVFPDLIDKPLAWQFGVFETGYAIAHSVFFAVPLAIVVGLMTRSRGRPDIGVAFGLGYLLHLPSDVVDGYLRGGIFDVRIVLWPLESERGIRRTEGFLEEFLRLFGRYQHELLAGELSLYVQVQLGIAVLAGLVWLADGAPVARELASGVYRLLGRLWGRFRNPER